jgi:hypothetical protein
MNNELFIYFNWSDHLEVSAALLSGANINFESLTHYRKADLYMKRYDCMITFRRATVMEVCQILVYMQALHISCMISVKAEFEMAKSQIIVAQQEGA